MVGCGCADGGVASKTRRGAALAHRGSAADCCGIADNAAARGGSCNVAGLPYAHPCGWRHLGRPRPPALLACRAAPWHRCRLWCGPSHSTSVPAFSLGASWSTLFLLDYIQHSFGNVSCRINVSELMKFPVILYSDFVLPMAEKRCCSALLLVVVCRGSSFWLLLASD